MLRKKICLLALATLFFWGGTSSQALALTRTNLRLAVAPGLELKQSGTVCAFAVSEPDQGMDLNGDGDTLDYVVHTHDAQTGATTNLGWPIAWGYGKYDLDGRLLAVAVSESGAGVDLNGDGDLNDEVLVVRNVVTGNNRNTQLAVGRPFGGSPYAVPFLVKRGLVALTVLEQRQANTDLNGDGDTQDAILHLYNAVTGIARNTNRHAEIAESAFRWNRRYVAFVVEESAQGNMDLNFDGDMLDEVVHVYDVAGNFTRNTMLAGPSSLGFPWHTTFPPRLDLVGHQVVFAVSEAEQGNADLNGDGDAVDFVTHLVAPAGVLTNLGAAGEPVEGTNRYAVYSVDETQDGLDANGDGDLADPEVYLALDTQTGTTSLIGHGRMAALAPGPSVVFARGEDFGDLNGNGSALDFVIGRYDLATGGFINGATAAAVSLSPFGGYTLAVGNRFVAFVGLGLGNLELKAMRLATGQVTSSGLAAGGDPWTTTRGRFVVSAAYEDTIPPQDLNGDGDTQDAVLFGMNAANGATFSFDLAVGLTGFTFERRVIYVAAHEGDSNLDLNQDGDMLDEVLVVIQ